MRAFRAEIPDDLEAESLEEFMQTGELRQIFRGFFGIDFSLPSGRTPIGELRRMQEADETSPHGRALLAVEASCIWLLRFVSVSGDGVPSFDVLGSAAPHPPERVRLPDFLHPERIPAGELMAVRLAELGETYHLIEPATLLPHQAMQALRGELAKLSSSEARVKLAPLVLGQDLAAGAGITARYCAGRKRGSRPTRSLDLSSILTPEGGLKFPLHRDSVRRAFYDGRLVFLATRAKALGLPLADLMACRRRPDRRACPGRLSATFVTVSIEGEEHSAIEWSCPHCGDGDLASLWEGTSFDATAAPDFPLEEPAEWAADEPFLLTQKELGALERRAELGRLALGLVLRARESSAVLGALCLEGPKDAFVELARGAERLLPTCSHQPQKKADTWLVTRLCMHAGLPFSPARLVPDDAV